MTKEQLRRLKIHAQTKACGRSEEIALVLAEREATRKNLRSAIRALKQLRVNVVVATCDGSCLCGSDAWLTWHNGIIDAAIVRVEGE